jgi:hypothetical protein
MRQDSDSELQKPDQTLIELLLCALVLGLVQAFLKAAGVTPADVAHAASASGHWVITILDSVVSR